MEQKPGYKTTEFWLSLVATLVGLFVGSGILPGEHLAMKIAGFVLAALGALGYSASRAVVKRANGTNGKGESGVAALDALVHLLAALVLCGVLLGLAAGCSGSTWRANATKLLAGGHQSGVEGYAQARDKWDTECLKLAKECTQPADKCAPLLECQATRHKVYAGLKAWFDGLAAFGEVVPLIPDGKDGGK